MLLFSKISFHNRFYKKRLRRAPCRVEALRKATSSVPQGVLMFLTFCVNFKHFTSFLCVFDVFDESDDDLVSIFFL
ncbi:hypothetical protein HanRHA438_Chr12g0539371 [Helianthus annuus]|nr:hypothetical protein HanRHA438_Chr12g0539371 [Helianthus annuus]